ncbi:hypothetical protein N2052_23875, partial [Escherichia coli]|nr:hypothetical protein [Escherichia coli]
TGNRRDLHGPYRRQRQMCIRDSSNKSLSKADLERRNEILRSQVISGLQASEELAKLLIASGVML